jgi:sarcosine oxidase subunit beta
MDAIPDEHDRSGYPLTVERHIVSAAAWGNAPRLPFGHADLVSGCYCKPEGSELFLLGWLNPADNVDPNNFAEGVRDVEAEGLMSAAMTRVPALERAELRSGWASLYDVSLDWQPVIGEIDDRIFVDAGTSGHGFKLAPVLGRYVAELVMGAPDPQLDQFDPGRFAQGHELAAGYGAARILG